MNRKFNHSKKFVLKKIGDNFVLFPGFSDLRDDELDDHFKKHMQKEDWEYCESIWAEAKSRGVRLDVPKKYFHI